MDYIQVLLGVMDAERNPKEDHEDHNPEDHNPEDRKQGDRVIIETKLFFLF